MRGAPGGPRGRQAAGGRARPAGPACGRAGRPTSPPGRPGSWSDRRAAASFLAAISTSVASSVTLRPDRVHAAVEQLRRVRALGPGRGPLRDRRPEALEPREALAARVGRAVWIEAGALAAVAGRADRIGRDEQRVAVAVDRDRAQPQHVAARLALLPEPAARPGVEVDLAGRDASRRAPRDPSTRASGRGRRGRPGRRPERGRRRGHATTSTANVRSSCRGAVVEADGDAGRGHRRLHVRDGVHPPVEDRRREHRIGVAVANGRHEVGRARRPARRHDRDRDRGR